MERSRPPSADVSVYARFGIGLLKGGKGSHSFANLLRYIAARGVGLNALRAHLFKLFNPDLFQFV